MKSSWCVRNTRRYRHPHYAMESITVDRGEAHLKDDIMPEHAELIFKGFWFSAKNEALQQLIDRTQECTGIRTGTVRCKLYKVCCIRAGIRAVGCETKGGS